MTELGLDALWDRVVRELIAEGSLSPQQRAWMRVSRVTGVAAPEVAVEPPSEFAMDALTGALRGPVTTALSRQLGYEVELKVSVAPTL